MRENFKFPTFTPKQLAKLATWKENGLTIDSYFATGVSLSAFVAALEGKLPATLAEQTASFASDTSMSGKLLNYVFPIPKNFPATHPLIEEAKRRHSGGIVLDDKEYLHDFSTESIIDKARSYALINSIEAAAETAFGIRCNIATLLSLAERVDIATYNKFQNDTKGLHNYDDPLEIEINANEEVIIEIIASHTNEELIAKLRQVLRCQGVVVFISKEILNRVSVVPDPEGDIEMVLVSSAGLSSDFIAGIELLGESEEMLLH